MIGHETVQAVQRPVPCQCIHSGMRSRQFPSWATRRAMRLQRYLRADRLVPDGETRPAGGAARDKRKEKGRVNFEKMRELRRKTKENAETFHSIADSQEPDPKYLQPLARKITVMESVR